MFNNRKQSIPRLFVAIADNQEQRKELKQKTIVPFQAFKDLQQDWLRLRSAANKFFQREGNTSGAR